MKTELDAQFHREPDECPMGLLDKIVHLRARTLTMHLVLGASDSTVVHRLAFDVEVTE